MIYLGCGNDEKAAIIQAYQSQGDIKKVFIFGLERHRLALPGTEFIAYKDIIEYRFFYRLLQEIDSYTLLVFNECLRTQNRYDLTYNCMRHFLQQAKHQLIFQYLPLIDEAGDFMTLFDWDTRSQWKRSALQDAPLQESRIHCRRVPLQFIPITISTDDKTRLAYAEEKRKLISHIGLRDPHTIPRNLYLMSGTAKAKWATSTSDRAYIGRNNRFKLSHMQTYKEDRYDAVPYTVFELPHNFIDFIDFVTLSGQTRIEVLTSDLKVDQWYLQRYDEWRRRIDECYSKISQ